MNKLTLTFSALLLTMAISANAQGRADPAYGQQLAATCSACHGPNGMSAIDAYPNLAGQNYEYLLNAMDNIRNGQRTNGTAQACMAVLRSVTGNQLMHLAAYYNSVRRY